MKLNHDLLAKAAGLERLDALSAERLDRYADLLVAANKKFNLISRSVDQEREVEAQIAISVLPLRLVPERISAWIDIGSGGGFPVLPLACVRGDINFTAVEPVSKKAFFIERTAQELDLDNLIVEATRIENIIATTSKQSWSAVSIKAVTDLSQSFSWAAKLLTDGGIVITYKPNEPKADDSEIARKHGFECIKSLDVKELIDTIDLRIVMYKKL